MEKNNVQYCGSAVRQELLANIEVCQQELGKIGISDARIEDVVMCTVGVLRSNRNNDEIDLCTQADVESAVELLTGYQSEEIVYAVLETCIRPQEVIQTVTENEHAQKVLIRQIPTGAILPTRNTDKEIAQILANIRKDVYAEIIKTATSAQTQLTCDGDWTEIVDAVSQVYDHYDVEFLPNSYIGFAYSDGTDI